MKNFKNRVKLLFTSILIVLLSSCEEDSNRLSTENANTGIYLRTISNNSTDFIVGDLDQAKTDITLEVVAADNGNVLKEVKVYVKYTDSENVFISNEKLLATVTQNEFSRDSESGLLRYRFVYTAAQMATVMNITDTSIFDANDKYDIRFEAINNNDNKFTNSSNGLDLSSEYYKSPFLYSFNLACISDLAGTYNVLSSGTSTDTGPTSDENPITNHPYTVNIISNNGGNYTLSDAYGGLYLLWYDIYGISGNYPGTFSDVCGTLSGTFQEPFGTTVNLTGTVNADGTLSIHWENGYGDFGDSIYTKI